MDGDNPLRSIAEHVRGVSWGYGVPTWIGHHAGSGVHILFKQPYLVAIGSTHGCARKCRIWLPRTSIGRTGLELRNRNKPRACCVYCRFAHRNMRWLAEVRVETGHDLN